MFSVAATSAQPKYVCSFKTEVDTFAELCERTGLAPAPYLARAHWVAAEDWDALSDKEYRALLTQAYELVRARLPRAVQAGLRSSSSPRPARATAARRGARR